MAAWSFVQHPVLSAPAPGVKRAYDEVTSYDRALEGLGNNERLLTSFIWATDAQGSDAPVSASVHEN